MQSTAQDHRETLSSLCTTVGYGDSSACINAGGARCSRTTLSQTVQCRTTTKTLSLPRFKLTPMSCELIFQFLVCSGTEMGLLLSEWPTGRRVPKCRFRHKRKWKWLTQHAVPQSRKHRRRHGPAGSPYAANSSPHTDVALQGVILSRHDAISKV